VIEINVPTVIGAVAIAVPLSLSVTVPLVSETEVQESVKPTAK
jgi:hypothetical protein